MSQKVRINNKVRRIAENWQELDPKLTDKVLKILGSNPQNVAKILILKLLLDIPETLFRQIGEADMTVLVRVLSWCNFDPDAMPIVPSFQVKHKHYFLPKKDFDDGTAIEFLKAQEAYNAFVTAETVEQQGEQMLILSAILLREKREGQRVKILDAEDDLYNKRLAVFSQHLPLEYSLAVLKYFAGVLILVEEVGNNLGVFDSDTSKSPRDGDDSRPNVNIFGWKTVFRRLAENGPFSGGYDGVCQRSFWEIIQVLAEREALNRAQTAEIDAVKSE